MKKILNIFACAAVLIAAGCAKISTTELYVPDETLATTGEVTLCVSIEDLNTKMTVDDNGHFLFREGDAIAVSCSDGTLVKFDIQGTGDTKRAFFKGTIPAGKTIGSCIIYPYASAVSCAGGRIKVRIPDTLEYGTLFQCPAAGKIGTDFNVRLCQLASMFQVTVDKFPASISKVEFSDAGGKTISGEFECSVDKIGEEGIAAAEGTGTVCFNLTTTPTKPSFFIPVAIGDYSDIQMSLYDAAGEKAGSQSVSDFVLSFARAGYSRAEISSEIAVKVKQLLVDDNATALTETAPGVWEATAPVLTQSVVSLNLDSKIYGFAPYSGAGGLGWCKNDKSALPYYNYTAEHKEYYYVQKAIGETMAVEDGGSAFWMNLDVAAQVHVVYDANYLPNGSYFIELLQDEDPAVVFDEQFDLFTCGGDVLWYLQGSQYGDDPSVYDGISASTPKKANWNASGSKNVMFDYPAAVASTVASSAYMKNRGMQDWTFCRADERPSAVQLGQGSYDAYLVTPKLSRMSGSGDVKITVEMSRYSSTAHGDISVMLLGGGSFKSAHASQTWGKDTKGVEVNPVSGDLSASGDVFKITESQYCICAGSDFNTSIYKPRSTFEFVASGVTADTQIKIFSPSNTRCIIFGIKVEKI